MMEIIEIMITTACEATYRDVIYRVGKIKNACKQI